MVDIAMGYSHGIKRQLGDYKECSKCGHSLPAMVIILLASLVNNPA